MLYLELFHGRKTPDEKLSDWGPNGPVFGPLIWVHTTYGAHIRMGTQENPDGNEIFWDKNDLIYYNGMYYGDMSVFDENTFASSTAFQDRLVEYDENLARHPTHPFFTEVK